MGPIVSRGAARGSVGDVDLEVEFRDGVSLRRQLEDALRVAIRSGRLPPGSVLPPSRDLAEQLGVSRGVVVDSYAQLATEGYLSARRGSGTCVAATAASGRPPARRQLSRPQTYRYELRPGTADFHAFPRAAWKAALVRALRELPDSRLTYADHRGVPELRNALAGYLARARGVVVDPEHVVVCCAASQALTVLWHVLRKRGGRRVAVEDPGWRWQRYTAEAARLEAVPMWACTSCTATAPRTRRPLRRSSSASPSRASRTWSRPSVSSPKRSADPAPLPRVVLTARTAPP